MDLTTSVLPVFTFVLGLIAPVVAVITANPIMIIPIAVGLVGVAVGLFKKFKR